MLSKLCVLIFLFLAGIVTTEERLKECIQIAVELMHIVEHINATDRFLRPPEEYNGYADKCEAMINCFKAKNAFKNPEIERKFNPCLFYIFYNRDFSPCAHKLIAKKDDNIPCLQMLFNDVHKPIGNRCAHWDSLQPCVQEQIGKLCDGKDAKKYEEQEKNIRIELFELT